MGSVAPAIWISKQNRPKIILIMFIQVLLIATTSASFAQQFRTALSPGNEAGICSEADFAGCIFSSGFEACLADVLGYPDTDLDGYGDSTSDPLSFCDYIRYGYADNDLDCDDNSNLVFPGNTESCDGINNDCDAATPDGSEDPDMGAACDGGDSDLCPEGALTCVGGELVCSDYSSDTLEVCDGVDNDCDGDIDEGCLELGSACSSGEECHSGNCVESVCCDTACDGADQSCLEINTGEPDGMCSVEMSENTPPWIVNNIPLFCEPDCQPAHIFDDQLMAEDQEDGPSLLTYYITSSDSVIEFFLDEAPTQDFTQQDINEGRVSFIVCPAQSGGAFFEFELMDSQGMFVANIGTIETEGCAED